MRYFRSALLVLIVALAAACGDKREISQDNMTSGLSIESVAVSENQTITEGNVYFASGDFNTAIEYYTEAMQQNKATAFYNIGVCYYLLNNIEQAELNFRQAVAEDPTFNEAVMNLVAVLAQQEKIVEADKFISRLIHTTKSTRVFVDMANIALKLNEPAKAAYYYKKALEIDSKSPFILANYANFLISIGEYQDGINILEPLPNKDFSMNYNLASAYHLMGDDSVSFSFANESLYSAGATEEGYNKLAYLFYDLKRYTDESKTLRILISNNPARAYKIRLVTSYINSKMLDKALDELHGLLLEYPMDIPLNMLNYEVLILNAKIGEAGKFIRSAYNKLGGDIVLYYYTKHLALYERSPAEVRSLIFAKRDNGWLNLARTVYSLRTGDFKDAASYLAKVPENIGHDYFSYKTFLLITLKQFRQAEQAALKMDQYKPDTFWYRLVIAWNLRQPDTLVALADEFRGNPAVNIRTPSFKYDLIPVVSDMGFTYRFDDTGVDAAAMLAYPIFLEPDEVVQFLIMGRSTLKDTEKENATKKLEGMKRNNEGVDYYYSFDFNRALAKFKEASALLSNNADVSYNIGITFFNLGNNEDAMLHFERAILQSKESPQGYLGVGLVHYRRSDLTSAEVFFDQSRKAAESNIAGKTNTNLHDIRAVHLALLASNRFGKLEEAKSIAPTNDAFAVSADILMEYFEDYNSDILKKLDKSPVFRVNEVADLLLMRHMAPDTYMETDSPDRYYTLAKKYLMLERGAKSVNSVNKRFIKDKVYLKDMVYGATFQKDKPAGLKYLQMLTDIDYQYPELYKASMYYFTWTKDFVNAEASYGSLDRMNYIDRLTAFYMLMYFLANYNEDRLNTYLELYEERFSPDYRSEIVKALINLNMKNVSGFYTIMSRVLKDDPYIFNKMFIEVDFAKF